MTAQLYHQGKAPNIEFAKAVLAEAGIEVSSVLRVSEPYEERHMVIDMIVGAVQRVLVSQVGGRPSRKTYRPTRWKRMSGYVDRASPADFYPPK